MHLAKTRRMVHGRIRDGQPFTFLDPPDGFAEPIPSSSKLIESWSARIRYVTANEWSSRRYLDMSRLGVTLEEAD